MAKRAGPKTAKTKTGEPIPLTTAIPGGMAQWYAPGDLTPRRSREYELIAAEMSPIIQATIEARSVTVPDGGSREFDGFDGPPVGLTRAQMRGFIEMTDAATWAHLKSWTLDRPLPADADALADLPKDLYLALTRHGSKLLAAVGTDFGIASLGEDIEQADEDLPTLA